MKVIFLDIDGVMNPQIIKVKNGSHASFVWFSNDAIHYLNNILRDTNAEIVISSNWRLFHSLEVINDMFDRNGVYKRAIDITPIPDAKTEAGILISKIRGNEIQSWLDAHPEADEFVIIDDDSDMGFLKCALVQTNPAIGLDGKAAREAIRILKEHEVTP